jgi:hypothetical protein
MTDTAVIERDEAVAEAISSGRSLRLIRKDFSLSERELDGILEKLWPLSTEARIRTIKHDVACLQRLIETLYEKGLNGDVNAAVACIRAFERKATMLGLDASTLIDLHVVKPPEYKSQHERISQVIQAFWDRMTPAEKALRDRLNGMNAEKALELLDRLGPEANANGNCAAAPSMPNDPNRSDSAVAVLSDSDETEPNP